MATPSVAVVVPVHGKLPLTLRFLGSFRRVTYDRYEIVVIDDGSPDDTAQHLARHYPKVRVLSGDGKLWWTGATNLGVRYALRRGFDYVLTINNDAVVSPGFLAQLVRTAQSHPRSIVGSRINWLDRPSRVWSAGGYMDWRSGLILQLEHYDVDERELLARCPSPTRAEILTGCGTLVPADCFREIGLYDRTWFPHYHADSELVLRAARRGWNVLADLHALIWNDEPNTCRAKHPFSLRSAVYWRPMLAIHLRYCPTPLLLRSLVWHTLNVFAEAVYESDPKCPPIIRLHRDIHRPAVYLKQTAARLLGKAA
jgi:GT2 family glycosyltransferase